MGKADGSGIIAALAVAGIVGPILFWALLLLAQSLHPGYDAWENSVSRLIFDPFGWLQTVDFYLLTLVTIAFGAAVYLGIAKSHAARIASGLLMIMGAAQLLVVVFRVDVNPYGPKSLAYMIHNIVVRVSAASFPLSALLLVPNLRSDERWHSFAYFTLAAAVAVLIMELGWLVSLAIEPHLIDPWFGLYERILFTIPLAWMMAVSARLLYITCRR